jgi:hypothetical protein
MVPGRSSRDFPLAALPDPGRRIEADVVKGAQVV